MKKVYFLKTCSTCKRIMSEFELTDFEQREIKSKAVSEEELQEMYALSKSYEALFSKKAQLYKSLGLKDKALTEADFKKHILEHYTFLSRPVFIINGAIYIGNSQQNILQVHKALS